MTLPVNVNALIGAIETTVAIQQADTGGKSFLRLDRGGFFVYGADDVEVEEKSKWAVNPNSFATGYIAWSDSSNAPVGEEMRPITGTPVTQAELPQVAGEWAQQVGMQLVCISGEDKGQEVVFKSSSRGGRSAFTDLLNQVVTHLNANAGTEEVVPVVTLSVESYKHQKYGKINTPAFNISEWKKMDDTTVAEPEEPVALEEPVAEEPPAKRRRRRA